MHAAIRDKNDRIDLLLERLSLVAGKIAPELQQAVASLISAVKYHDNELIASHVNSFFEAVRDSMNDYAQQHLGSVSRFREARQQIMEEAKFGRIDDYDALGSRFQGYFDEALNNLAALSDGCVRTIRQAGYPIELEGQIEREMEELKTLKGEIFEDWPWSNRSLPPIDRRMIEESRKAFARGEGESINDLIGRLER